jgi:hypothetical protein
MASKRIVEALRRVLGGRQGGLRTCVLVVGDGLNVQAQGGAGADGTDAWDHVLKSLWRQANGKASDYTHLPASMPTKWDALLNLWCARFQLRHDEADRRLRAVLCRRLQRLEHASKPMALYDRLLKARFRDVISLNLDRRLTRHGRHEHVLAPSEKTSDPMRRHTLVRHPDGLETRVWHAHGDAGDAESVCLGVGRHTELLVDLEDRRRSLMEAWMEQVLVGYTPWEEHPSGSRTSAGIFERRLQKPKKCFARRGPKAASWYDLFFLAPLAFIGASLHLDEWPLWWLLHQRARNFVAFDPRDGQNTFFLTAEPEAHLHIKGQPAGIELVDFPSYTALWDFVLTGEAEPSAPRRAGGISKELIASGRAARASRGPRRG